MKKFSILAVIIPFVIFTVCIKEFNNLNKVLQISSPVEIYIDKNRNYIFDETEPYIIKNVKIVDKHTDFSKYPLLRNLSEEEIFFINYIENEIAQRTLKNRFVKIKDNEIYIDKKKYTDLLSESGFFFDDSIESQKKLLEKIKKTDLKEFVIYNVKSKKYHSLNCDRGRKSKTYKIYKKDELPATAIPCPYCNLDKREQKDNHKKIQIDFNGNNNYLKEGNIQIFFSDLNKRFLPDKKCRTNMCKKLKREIDSAKESIDFAIFGINNQDEIFNALINAQKRGVKIRWVSDYDKRGKVYYKDNIELQKHINNVVTDEEYEKINKSAIMHNKFFIFDNKKVWTGSSNITNTDITDFNANYAVLIDSKEIADIYKQEFMQMYGGKFHTQKDKISNNKVEMEGDVKLKVLFSPQDNIINNYLIPLINEAKEYIYIPIFYITSKELIPCLENAHKRGVDIKIINDATNAHNKYSIHKKLREIGIKVKTENYAGKIHAKAMIIDDKITAIGSMNYTKSANYRNDENIIIIYNTNIAKYFKETFKYLWNKIPDKYLKYDPKAESPESIGSCFDGIDNDYDDKIDAQDEGCFIKR